MQAIGYRDNFWKTISIIILVLLVIFSVAINLILVSPFYLNNNFIDYQHPTEAKWDVAKMKAGQSPVLKIEFEPASVSQERFYDYFSFPASLRIDLSTANFIFLILAMGIFYFICFSLIISDEDFECMLLFWTVAGVQVLLLIILIVSSIICYQAPDLTTLGIHDVQMTAAANSEASGFNTFCICIMILTFIITDIVVVVLSLIIMSFFSALAKKIKAVIIDRLTLGNNVMLCCNNGRFELISIDFKLKWIPFPTLFLERRILDSFSAHDNRSSRHFRDWLGNLSITIEEEHIQKLAQLNMNGGSLLISPDDSVSIVRLESAVEWRPFPQTVVHQEIIRRVSFDNFFRYLTADSKQVALEELKGMLVGSYQERFQSIGQLAVSSLIKSVCAKALAVVKKSLPQIIADQNNLAAQRATDLLQVLTDEKLKAFKQEIVASIQESLEVKVSRNIKEQILSPLRDILSEQLPLVNNKGSIDALPEGTKFFFSHGGTQIVVVEQKPQLRSLHFHSDFEGGGGRYNLAFPYIIFLIIFRNGEFNGLGIYYANKPMTSLDSEVFSSNLPNVANNGVCTGFHGCQASSLAGKVEEVIAHFWQSQFNNDYRHGYRRMADRGGAFRNLKTWQKASQKDPLFVLRVNWFECGYGYSPNQVISSQMGGTLASKITDFDHLISQALQSEGVNIGAIARECCERINIDKSYPQKTINALREQLASLSLDVGRAFEKTLSGLVELPDEKSLMADISQATALAVEEVISQDFSGYANKVLLRRRVNSQELIRQILNQQ